MYSVYDRRTEMPIVIYGTAEECAKAMKIEKKSFYSYILRSRRGYKLRRYEVFEDDTEEVIE